MPLGNTNAAEGRSQDADVRPQGPRESQLDMARLCKMAVPMAFFPVVRAQLAVSRFPLRRRRLYALALGKQRQQSPGLLQPRGFADRIRNMARRTRTARYDWSESDTAIITRAIDHLTPIAS
jgi:hypothetical protein